MARFWLRDEARQHVAPRDEDSLSAALEKKAQLSNEIALLRKNKEQDRLTLPVLLDHLRPHQNHEDAAPRR
jgi:hypothetical protein